MTSAEPDALLRPAVPGDVSAMVGVRVRARRAAPMPVGLHGPDLEAALDADQPGDEAWVAEVEGEVVGYVRFVHAGGSRVSWLDDLYVDPLHAGQGIGSALLDLVKSCLPAGFGLWVFERNLPARNFYAVHGFVERDRAPAEESPDGEPELRLEWSGAAVGNLSVISPSL